MNGKMKTKREKDEIFQKNSNADSANRAAWQHFSDNIFIHYINILLFSFCSHSQLIGMDDLATNFKSLLQMTRHKFSQNMYR